MSYPGLAFALMVGLALGTAIYYYFTNENLNQNYQYDDQGNHNYYNPSSASDGYDVLPRRKPRKKNGNQTCSICLEKLESSASKIISCGHVFHDKCITLWFKTRRICPNCRAEQP